MTEISLFFFGQTRIHIDGIPTPINYRKGLAIVAYLAVSGQQQSRDSLATLLWPEHGQTAARTNLRRTLYRLKQAPIAELLTSDKDTVQLLLNSNCNIDVVQFQACLLANQLADAVALYQGDFIADLYLNDSSEFEAWATIQREHFRRQALDTLHVLTKDALATRNFQEAKTLARRQIEINPLRESAYQQLIAALVNMGERNEALVVYKRFYERLSHELGIEPSQETAILYQRVKNDAFGPYFPDVSESTPLPPKRRHNLPAQTTPFIGREKKLLHLCKQLEHPELRLVTIVGPGGMGKSRLALAAGEQLLPEYDGVYLVDLAALSRTEDIVPTIAAVLDYRLANPQRELKEQLLTFLRQRRLLLILDNFEHLLPGVSLVTDILTTVPDITILTTSRQRLNLSGETRFELVGMNFPDRLSQDNVLDFEAVQLFLTCARRIQTTFMITQDNVQDVIRICQLVDGMPLGIVLAAAWLELLSPAEIVAEIEKGIDFLAADLNDLPVRQRNLQAVLSHAWNIMTLNEQRVMARLSVFRGGFTREASEYVANANLRILLGLVNKSLIQRDSESGRYHVHELLRQYAATRLHLAEDYGATYQTHCQYFAQFINHHRHETLVFLTPDVPNIIAADEDNVRQAWDYAVQHKLADELAKMALGLVNFYLHQGLQPHALIDAGIQSLRQSGLPANSEALYSLRLAKSLLLLFTDHSQARRILTEIMQNIETLPNPALRFRAYGLLGQLAAAGEDPMAIHWAEKALHLALETDDKNATVLFRCYLLIFRVDLGYRDDGLLQQAQELLAHCEAYFPHNRMVITLHRILNVLWRELNASEKAIDHAMSALNLAKRWRDLGAIGSGAALLSELYLEMKQSALAKRWVLDALDWHLAIGNTWQVIGCLYGQALNNIQLYGGIKEIIPILSAVYHHREAIAVYKTDIDKARAAFRAELGDEELFAEWQRGKSMTVDEVVAITREILTCTQANQQTLN